MKIFILDNYDSFTYNLVHILEQYASEVCIKRNNKVTVKEISNYDKIVFSPGPGLPKDVQLMFDIINDFKAKKPILGVCLGHQAIAEYFGGNLINMPEVNHGQAFLTKIIKDDYIFNQIPKDFYSGRYHSWIVNQQNFPNELTITSVDEKNQIMSLKHNHFDIRGVQFHPESIMTPHGKQMLKNWVLKQ